MNASPTPETPANCSPVLSIAGVMPGGSEMTWETAYPNPDRAIAELRPAGHGPSFSLAGAMPRDPEASWSTAMPDPTRQVLDAHGYVITKIEAAARAAEALPAGTGILALRPARAGVAKPAA